MKKTAALVCALLLVLLLPGCTLVQQVGNAAKQAEELPVAECVQAAADGDGPMYDLSGIRLYKEPQKGIYIKGHKKTVAGER